MKTKNFWGRLCPKLLFSRTFVFVFLLLPGQKPCAYFVIISAQDSAYRFLSSLFFSLALPRLSDYARLKGKSGRLPVLVNFCLDEYCN